MDKLRSMEIFTAVVDEGSFTAAATRFDMSAVMVGKHVRFLEELLGARLLARTTRRQSLTEIGEQFVEQCRSILEQVRAAESGAEAMRLAPRGRLRISAPVTFGSESLSPLLPAYLARYPEVSLDLELNDRLVDVVDDGYDAAIRISELDDSGMIARRLRPYRMLICASPEYLARHGTPRVPADLARHECLDFMHWKKLVRWRLGDDDGSVPARVSRFRSNNGQALKQAALAGFGIVMQAQVMLADEVAAGRLVSLMEAHIPPPRTMHVLYPRDRQATPKLTTFIDFLLEHFGPL
ncbi:LysR family transcriptional regulator [Massilia sp. CCM 8734]|uniref:LysR family transcriptional regulator n=1 Tax=Massilia sp. CCM 8734 TaxID=2609283 RepID=UPI00141F62BD|nr:LysR family transcriptional regulator [Massilia sp. CCM 8734]NIA00312.1 LysR family transcriptional regulator [Massilia sp. CCM 8734]